MKTLGTVIWKCLQGNQAAFPLPQPLQVRRPVPFFVPFSDFPQLFGNHDENTALPFLDFDRE